MAVTSLVADPRALVPVEFIPDPANSLLDKKREIPFVPRARLHHYAQWAGVPDGGSIEAVVDGQRYQRERWPDIEIEPGDKIVFIRWHGGIFVAAAILGISVEAAAASTWGVVIAAGFNLLVSTGLGFLAQAFAEKPEKPRNDQSDHRRRTGVRSLDGGGKPLPALLGEGITGGLRTGFFTTHTGTKSFEGGYEVSAGGQRTAVRYELCTGPVQAINGYQTDQDGLSIGQIGQSRVLYSHEGVFAESLTFKSAAGDPDRAALVFYVSGSDAYVTSAVLSLRKVGTPTGDIRVRIEGTSPPVLEPNDIGSYYVSKPADASLLTAYSDVAFDFQVPVGPSKPTQFPFFLVFEYTGPVDASNYVEMELKAVPGPGFGQKRVSGTWTNTAARAPIGRISANPRQMITNGLLKFEGNNADDSELEGLYSHRLGRKFQSAYQSVSGATLERIIDQDLTIGVPIERTTQNAVNGFEVVIGFDRYYHQGSAGIGPGSFICQIRYRVSGSTDWQGTRVFNTAPKFQSPDSFGFKLDLPPSLQGSVIDIEVLVLTPKPFNGPSASNWKSLKEFADVDAQPFPFVASGIIDVDAQPRDVTWHILGKVVHFFDGTRWREEYTDNMAYQLMALLLAPEWGGGRMLSIANLDIDSFVDVAENHCDELKYNKESGKWERAHVGSIWIDKTRPWWEWAVALCSSMRCTLIRTGDKFKLVADRPTPMSRVFAKSDIIEGSLRFTYLGMRKRASKAVVVYYDKNVNFTEQEAPQESLILRDKGIMRTERVTLVASNNRHHALRHAKWLVNKSERIKYSVAFDTALRSLDMERKDVFGLGHEALDMEHISGRITEVGAGGNAVKIDEDVVIDGSDDPYRFTYETLKKGVGPTAGTPVIQSYDVVKGAGPFPKTIAKGSWVDLTPSFPTDEEPSIGDSYSFGPIRDIETSDLQTDEPPLIKFTLQSATFNEDGTIHVEGIHYVELTYDDEPDMELAPKPAERVEENRIPGPPRRVNVYPNRDPQGNYHITVDWQPAPWPITGYTFAIFFRQAGVGGDRWHSTPDYQGITGTSVTFRNVAVGQTYYVAVCPQAPGTGRWNNPASKLVGKGAIRMRRLPFELPQVSGLA